MLPELVLLHFAEMYRLSQTNYQINIVQISWTLIASLPFVVLSISLSGVPLVFSRAVSRMFR